MRYSLRDKLISKVSATGEIKPKEYVEIQSEIAGVITAVYVKEGDVVQKGDLLLRIDPLQTEADARAQRSAVDIAQSDALNQQAQISLQQTNVDRDRANLNVAEAELLRAQSAAEIAETPARPSGTGNALEPSSPQPTIVPSDRRASPKVRPAAMARTSRRPSGGDAWPTASAPQAATVPSARSARLKPSPAATATTSRRFPGTSV